MSLLLVWWHALESPDSKHCKRLLLILNKRCWATCSPPLLLLLLLLLRLTESLLKLVLQLVLKWLLLLLLLQLVRLFMAELPMMRGSAGGWLLQKVGSVVAVHLLSSVMIVVFVAAAMVVVVLVVVMMLAVLLAMLLAGCVGGDSVHVRARLQHHARALEVAAVTCPVQGRPPLTHGKSARARARGGGERGGGAPSSVS